MTMPENSTGKVNNELGVCMLNQFITLLIFHTTTAQQLAIDKQPEMSMEPDCFHLTIRFLYLEEAIKYQPLHIINQTSVSQDGKSYDHHSCTDW